MDQYIPIAMKCIRLGRLQDPAVERGEGGNPLGFGSVSQTHKFTE